MNLHKKLVAAVTKALETRSEVYVDTSHLVLVNEPDIVENFVKRCAHRGVRVTYSTLHDLRYQRVIITLSAEEISNE